MKAILQKPLFQHARSCQRLPRPQALVARLARRTPHDASTAVSVRSQHRRSENVRCARSVCTGEVLTSSVSTLLSATKNLAKLAVESLGSLGPTCCSPRSTALFHECVTILTPGGADCSACVCKVVRDPCTDAAASPKTTPQCPGCATPWGSGAARSSPIGLPRRWYALRRPLCFRAGHRCCHQAWIARSPRLRSPARRAARCRARGRAKAD
jgi:hypothetical protein